jgi:hypothetical protein
MSRKYNPDKERFNVRPSLREWEPESPVCMCGRSTRPTHCRHCGSISVRKRITDVIKIPSLTNEFEYVVFSYHCILCKKDFYENIPCSAPRVEIGSGIVGRMR